MKITFDFANDVIVLPKDAVADNLRGASREELCVLLSCAAEPDMTQEARAKALGVSAREVSRAVSFWRKAGVIASEKKPKPEKKPVQKKRGAPLEEGAPHYDADELADAIVRPEFRQLLDHCQQTMGKVFNASEAEKVVGICDYLSVSPDFVALLCSHLAGEGKLSLRLLEKSAMEYYDRGITDFESLNNYIVLREKSRSVESKIRKLFGIGGRSFTAAERKYIESWTKTEYPFEMIEYAYESMVNTTGNASMKYMNSIIERWVAEGYKTLDEAKAAADEFQRNKKPRRTRNSPAEGSSVSSFATDDFFEAAMRRSYGDSNDNEK